MKSRLLNAECLLFIPISKNVQSNSVLKLVVARNAWLHRNPACFGFMQSVMMTRLMMNGDKVFLRAGLFDETGPFLLSALTAASSIPSKLQASLIFSVDPSLSFQSDDEPDHWSTDAKLKFKVGVVSVTVKQHTEGRLQDSQSMLDF